MKQIVKFLFNMWIAPAFGLFVANSTTWITTIAAAAAVTPSATTQTNANAAAGPIQDVAGNVKLIQTKIQEILELMNYLLNASMKTASSQSAPTAGPVTSSSDSVLYNALVSLYQQLN